MFPTLDSDETPFILSNSPGPGSGDAEEVEGEGTANGEFAECKGVPDLVCELNMPCWSICGDACCDICGEAAESS